LTLARAGGVEMADALEVINNSAVASPLIGYKTKMMTTGDYTPAFEVTGMMKDFDLALGVGRSEHLPMPIIAQVRQQYEAAYAAGAKDLDFFVLVREAARIAGIK
jgi:3-hydroxyisobutyrate dehydrogenase-like beta-hydroxyacid dehydrogenase